MSQIAQRSLSFVIIEHNVRVDVKGEERRGETMRSTEAPVTAAAAAAAVLTTPTSTELQGQRKGKGEKDQQQMRRLTITTGRNGEESEGDDC